MGYLNNLGTSYVEKIHQQTGWPMDKYGHLLDARSPHDGRPTDGWNKKGTELPNFTSPYGHLAYACGTGDDFHCFNFAEVNAGPRGDFVILHSVINSETGHFIQDGEYLILPANSTAERTLVVRSAMNMLSSAIDWCHYNDIHHSRKGWNQDPLFFVAEVARAMFGYKFRYPKTPAGNPSTKPYTDREMRFYGARIARLVNSIVEGK